MKHVSITAGGFTVDADILAAAFALDQEMVQAKMRAGEITSLCATGIGEDAGRFRITFRHQSRALRLTLDARGAIVATAMEVRAERQRI